MQCQSCKKNDATIHLTEISNGQRMETHLCQACAQKQGLAVQTQIPLNELLSTLLGAQGAEPQGGGGGGTTEETVCPHCGMTLQRFARESLLGCPHDYELFEKNLEPLIERSQGGQSHHCGKVPQSAGRQEQDKMRLHSLRQRLEQAVRQEDYETAARLRDEIKKLQ
jgi:protein arginine kinase activator